MELPILDNIGDPSPAAGCKARGSCGDSRGPGEMDPETWEKVRNHPCYSEEAHHHYARMHVAVAPACNIQCHYCNRKYDCANESRPGVISERLTPEEAALKVLAVAGAVPQMTVLGIAGPGDPLANPDKTFRTFELIAEKAPDIKLCLSTNGLLLPDYVDRIKSLNIDHVTLTINMIDPEVGERIYSWVYYKNKRWKGRDAARILSDQQLEGLDRLTSRGILCKVNSVMIPGINDDHLVEVNGQVKSLGAFLHNIMPLISAQEHGTYYGLNGQRGPTAKELKALQDKCEGEMNLMRHCRQCRADAVGLLGEDRSREFTMEKIREMDVEYDLEKRRAYQMQVEMKRLAARAAKEEGLKTAEEVHADLKILIAVATRGEGKINEHFGHAREFQIYEVSREGCKFAGHRRVDMYCQGGWGEEDTLETVIQAIADCTAVFVSKVGRCPRETLEAAGIEPVDRYAFDYIEKSALTYLKEYAEKVRKGEIVHRDRGDASIRTGALIFAEAKY